MKTLYIIAGAAALWFLSRNTATAKAKQLAQVGGLAESGVVDGTNWTTDMWSQFTSATSNRSAASNLAGATNAHPATTEFDTLGLSPKWDGSL